MIRIAFWAFAVLDLVGLAILFVLGLAAAGSARTNTFHVVSVLLVLPCIALAVAVVLFLRATAAGWRLIALLLAVAARTIAEVQLRTNTNEQGELTFFHAGPMREIAEAIARNHSSTVARLAKTVDVNRTGLSDMTLLVLAMRQLRITPEQPVVLRVLLEAKPRRHATGRRHCSCSSEERIGSRGGQSTDCRSRT